MGIRQFITCYNLCCFILSKRDQSTFRSFPWSTPILRLSVVSYKHKNIQNVHKWMSLIYRETLGRWLPISVLSAFNHSRDNKKTLINKLSENVSGYVHIVLSALCVSFSWAVQTLLLQYFCSLFSCLLWFFY